MGADLYNNLIRYFNNHLELLRKVSMRNLYRQLLKPFVPASNGLPYVSPALTPL